MRDYICMEEDRITYIRGRYKTGVGSLAPGGEGCGETAGNRGTGRGAGAAGKAGIGRGAGAAGKTGTGRGAGKAGIGWGAGASGKAGKGDCVQVRCWDRLEPEEGLESALEGLAQNRGLKGARVDLVLAGNSLHSRRLTLPRAGRNAMRRMAWSRLAAEGEEAEDCVLSVDRGTAGRTGRKGPARLSRKQEGGRRGRRKGPVRAVVYYGDHAGLKAYREALAGCGISIGRVLALPDCMALMAWERWKEGRILLLDAGEEGTGLYALWNGRCLAWRQTSLRAGRFCRKGAEELLYEELAEQAAALMKEAGEEGEAFEPDRAVLTTDCLPSLEKGAERLERCLGIPCEAWRLSVEEERAPEEAGRDGALAGTGIPVRCLAACVAGSPGRRRRALELTAPAGREGPGVFTGLYSPRFTGRVLFFLANVLLAAGLSFHAFHRNRAAQRELAELEQAMEEREYRDRSGQARRMEKRIRELSECGDRLRVMEEAVAGKKELGMDAFRAFTQALGPGMRIEGLSYEGEWGVLEVTVSLERAEEAPDYVDRVRETGPFREVWHRLWEERPGGGEAGRIHAVIRARLGTGGEDATE